MGDTIWVHSHLQFSQLLHEPELIIELGVMHSHLQFSQLLHDTLSMGCIHICNFLNYCMNLA